MSPFRWSGFLVNSSIYCNQRQSDDRVIQLAFAVGDTQMSALQVGGLTGCLFDCVTCDWLRLSFDACRFLVIVGTATACEPLLGAQPRCGDGSLARTGADPSNSSVLVRCLVLDSRVALLGDDPF